MPSIHDGVMTTRLQPSHYAVFWQIQESRMVKIVCAWANGAPLGLGESALSTSRICLDSVSMKLGQGQLVIVMQY